MMDSGGPMTEIGPKTPRIRDERYLAFLRRQPCCTCGTTDMVEAAHIRSGSLDHDKRETGLAEKPSDAWALPQCRPCHRLQHSVNELEYWKSHGIDPFTLALKYYTKATAIGETRPGSTSKRKKRVRIYPKGFGPRIASRPFPKAQRKFGQ
jgi:hypothetical protein